LGKRRAAHFPDHVKMLPRAQAIATQLPHAVGLAWALKLQKKASAVLVFCGDGASSEGEVHEACNLAGVIRAPVVFVVQNNSWAISTPTSRQTAARSIAARGPGYGFSGYLVDGNDVHAVLQVAREAIARARSGGGPSLIECRTYRLGFHNTSDNPSEYRTAAEVEEAGALDPILRLERYLASRDKWTGAVGVQMREETDERIKSAISAAQTFPANTPADVFDHVYMETSQRMDEQRRRALRLDGG
jgi:pyruvate dehydrogenase E1 component alpha subunit